MTVRERYEGLQSVLEQGGKYGCLFLAICSIIEEVEGTPQDIVHIIRVAQAHGWLDTDFTCKNQLALLRKFTGYTWKRVEKPAPLGNVADNEYTVERWKLGNTTHFKRRGWDVYENSNTVRNGVLDCYYVYSWSN